MDVLAVTDFPDIRLKSLIQSASDGSIIIIPREGGYLVRSTSSSTKLDAGERVANRNITSDDLIATARRILHPYTLDVKEIAWWSVYEIGQRLTDKFDDVPAEEIATRLPRVFIAGDACHTHSPKAGQGMNVSMQDAFQSRMEARLRPAAAQRAAPAAQLFGGTPGGRAGADRLRPRMGRDPRLRQGEDNKGVGRRRRPSIISSGTAAIPRARRRAIAPSLLTGEADHQHLAKGLVIGTRFHSAPVIRLADAKPVHLGHVVKADGRLRILRLCRRRRSRGAKLRRSRPVRLSSERPEVSRHDDTRPRAPISIQ